MHQSKKPNVLYIMTDQQRFDSLGCSGRSICKTPNLDELANKGVRFDNAYSVCGLCSPARASMLTGMYPHNHRMWNNNDMMQWAVRNLPDDVRLISQDLIDAGYNCGYVGKWHCGIEKLPSTYGFVGMDVPGYGNPYKTKEYAEYIAEHGLKPPEPVEVIVDRAYGGTLSGPVEACIPHFIAEYAIDLMKKFNEERKDSGKPFMMFVSFWGPHHPCFIPEPYASMYEPQDVELWPNVDDDLSGKPRSMKRFSAFYPHLREVSKEQLRRLIAKYWGFCTFIDYEIGRLLEALEEMGIADETAVLFSSDHGDLTGAHGRLWDKGPFMYEETYHIPLIIRIPWLDTKGAVCQKFVSNMDLATTVLDIAGLPIPGYHDARSLLPLVADPESNWRDDIMCEFHGHRYLYSQRMVRWDRYKYIFNPSDYDELYDLANDPYEMNNLINQPEYKKIAEEGRLRLLKWIKDSKDPLEFAAKFLLGNSR